VQTAAAAGRLDRFQRWHRWIAVPLAARQRYADDRGFSLSATIAGAMDPSRRRLRSFALLAGFAEQGL
jgi:hypothetical protein